MSYALMIQDELRPVNGKYGESMIFCERLRQTRLSRGVLAKDVAAAMSVSYRNYQRYENGSNDPPISKVIILADYFNVSIDYLVGRTDDPKLH